MKKNLDNLTRRDFLKYTSFAAAATTCVLTGGCSLNQINSPKQKNFYYAVAADPQLFWGAQKNWQKTIEELNQLKPEFLIVCGDMINDPTNEKQTKAYFAELSKLDKSIKVYHVPGNHDIVMNKPRTIEWYKKYFGELYYSFEHKNNLFIVINSNVLKEPKKYREKYEEQMAWLKATLKKAQNKYDTITVYMHHPLCLKSCDEKTQYFNIPKDTRADFIKLMQDNNVIAVFSGHYHKNAFVQGNGLELVTTSSCGIGLAHDNKPADPLGFRLVKIDDETLTHEYFALEEMPAELNL